MGPRNQSTKNCSAVVTSKVPASHVDEIARRAAQQAAHGSKAKDMDVQKASFKKNASRDVHSMIRRLSLLWDIPITKAQYHIHGAEDLTAHYIDPIDLFQFLLDKRPAILFGGLQDQQDQAHLLKSWWHAFRGYQPGHRVYTEHNDALDKTVPVLLYGDEGKDTRLRRPRVELNPPGGGRPCI